MNWSAFTYLLFPVMVITTAIGFIATAWTYFSTKKLSRIGLYITFLPALLFAIIFFLLK